MGVHVVRSGYFKVTTAIIIELGKNITKMLQEANYTTE